MYTLFVTGTSGLTVRSAEEIQDMRWLLSCSLKNVTRCESVICLAAMLEALEWAEGGYPLPFRELIESLAEKYGPRQVPV